jgi:hypothetical protein
MMQAQQDVVLDAIEIACEPIQDAVGDVSGFVPDPLTIQQNQ